MPSAHAEPLTRLRITGNEQPHLAWSEGTEVSVPAGALPSLAPGIARDGTLHVLAGMTVEPALAGALRLRAAYTPPPTSARLPISYRSVPGPLRRTLARALGRVQRGRVSQWAKFPGWPLDLSADFLADLASPARRLGGITPVVLSHDIDSEDGLRNLVSRFLPLEEAVSATSTNFIVPAAWPLDHGLLAETKQRGHELGIHGYDHSNRTPFTDTATRRRRLATGRELANRYQMTGYRAPSLARSAELLAELAGLYEYDSSIPTSGGLFPVPNNGCATARPFRLGGLVELPLSMPRDGSLQFLGYRPQAILDLWTACASRIADAGGVVVLLTHCENHFSGQAPMLNVYRQFLEWVAADGRFSWSTAAGAAAIT